MKKQAFTLAELATLTKSRLVGNPNLLIKHVADLESASAEDASFLANPNYEQAMIASEAGVIFISPTDKIIEGKNFLITDNPSAAFQQTIELFLSDALSCSSGFQDIHPTAVIHETAKIGKQVTIGPYTVIDRNVTIGDHTIISSGCHIGTDSSIGEKSYLHPHVTIRERCHIGNRVIIQPGAVIGSCGFGYITNNQGQHIKLNQLGTVVIEDDVEIGANTTIDRSRFKATTIGKGSKIDNLVQIGHGVIIGQHNIIVSQTGIAGSSKTGNYVVMGGQVGVAGHLTIADKTMIGAKAGVSKSIKSPGGKYTGVPATPLGDHNRNNAYLRNIKEYVTQIKQLQERLDALEKKK